MKKITKCFMFYVIMAIVCSSTIANASAISGMGACCTGYQVVQPGYERPAPVIPKK